MSCSKCSGDAPKYTRMKKRKSGKRTKSIASYCIICHREDQKIREQRRYKKKLAYNREWKKRNREKANAYERKYYHKKKRSSWGIIYSSQELQAVGVRI